MNKSKLHFDEEPWYSYQGGEYNGSLAAYYDPTDFDWVPSTEKQFPAFRKHLETYLNGVSGKMEPYFLRSLMSKENSWKVKSFFGWGQRIDETCDQAPEVEKFFKSIPGMVSASVSLLEANTSIAPHYGDSSAVFRCHLGIRIPAGLPDCGLEVNNESKAWEEGKWTIFCDAVYHRAWNNTNEPRYIVMMDVLRPEFISQKRNVCSNVLSLLHLQKLEIRFPSLKKMSGFGRGIVRVCLKMQYYTGLLKWH